MANNTLGTINVDLRANTAGFVGDLGKAARAAENLGKDINKSFSGLARIASQTFGAFGPAANQAISTISTGIAAVGRNAASAAKDFGKMGGAMGLIGAAAGGTATALGLVAIGALEIARRTSAAVDKLNEQAQALSIDIEALSSLGLAAEQSGLSQEALGKALQGMSKSAFAASNAADGTANAYTRMGVSVKNQDGTFKSQLQLFREISAKLALMPNDFNKTALAGQIFGRGVGSAIIPLANLGTGIDNAIEKSRRLGLVISKETAAAADKFQDTLSEIGSAIEGVKIKLMERLLPALQQAANGFNDWLADQKNIRTLENIADASAMVARVLLNSASAVIFFGRAMVALRAFGEGWNPFDPDKAKAFSDAIRDATGELKEYWATSKQAALTMADGFAAGNAALRNMREPFKLLDTTVSESQKKIDSMLKSLQTGADTFRMSAGETEAYKLKLEGASLAEQRLGAAIAQRTFLMKEAVKPMQKPLGLGLFQPEYDPGTIPAPKIEQIMPEIDIGAIGHLNTLNESLKAQAKILNIENRPAIEKYRDGIALLVEMQNTAGLSAQAFQIEADKLKQQLQSADPVILTVRQSMSEMFSQAIFRAGSLREAFGNLLSRIGEVIFQVNVLDPLLKNLGTGGGGGGGGILGFLGGIGKSILGGLGGLGGGAASAFNPSTYTFKQIPFMASGGSVSAGRPYIVGDSGPELFVPSTSGRIMANGQAAGGVSITYQIDARGATDPAATAMAVQRAIQQSEERSVQRAKGEYLELLRRTPSGSFA